MKLLNSNLTLPFLFIAMVTFVSEGVTEAGTIHHPAGLTFGDEYRIVFVTDRFINGVSPRLVIYNNFVSLDATASGSLLANLDTTWSAIVSTAEVDAIDNTSTDPSPAGDTGVPLYLPDGVTRVAPHYDFLWSGVQGFDVLEAPINITPSGVQPTRDDNTVVWTGTNLQGTAQVPLGEQVPTLGFLLSSNSRWIANGEDILASNPGRLYGISGILTVIPEPATAFLAAFGFMAVLGQHSRTSVDSKP